MVEKYSDDEFEALLTKYDYNFKRGDIVKGVVCAYESDGAIVDIGSKSTAFVPSYEISADKKARVEDVLEKNTEYEFLILNDCDENGKFNLSYKKVHLAHTWAELAKVKEADETIAVVVAQTVKGGLIVELFDDELFSVRNIEADSTGAFYDLLWRCNPSHPEPTGEGKVFVIGDLHAPKHNEILLDANIRAIEKFGCDTVVLHDSVNMSYISHHNVDKAITRAQIAEEGNANILKEIESFADILNELCNTPGVKRVIIPYSNHPAHFEKFIQDMGRMSKDDINLRTSLQVALAMLDNKNVLQFMTEELVGYKNDKIEWLREDEGKEIYGVQVGLHGCEKVNGGKMTPTSTNNAFKKTVLAHKHSAGIDGDTITVGIACEKEQGYNHGLSSWTESSAIVHPNGTVQLLTFVNVRGEYKVWP